MDQKAKAIVEEFLEEIESNGELGLIGARKLEQETNLASKKLRSAKGVKRLILLQQREDLAVRLAEAKKRASLEEVFVANLAEYAETTGLSYTTLREFGVPKELLERSGIRRTRRKVKVEAE